MGHLQLDHYLFGQALDGGLALILETLDSEIRIRVTVNARVTGFYTVKAVSAAVK